MKFKSFALFSKKTLFLVFLFTTTAIVHSRVFSQSQDTKEAIAVSEVANSAVGSSSQIGIAPVTKWSVANKSRDSRIGVEFPDIQSGKYAFASQESGRYGVVIYDVEVNDNTRNIAGSYFSFNVLKKLGSLQLRDALLSPDKEKVLFKVGFSSEEDLYSLYVLDLSSGAITKVSSEKLASPDVSWSTDGSNVSYILGGNKNNGLYSNYPPQDYAGPRQLMVYSLKEKGSSLIISNDTIGESKWMNDRVLFYNVLFGPDPYYPVSREKYIDNVKKGIINKPEIHFFDVDKKLDEKAVGNSVSPFPSSSGKYVLSFSQNEIQSNEPLENDWLDRIKNYEVSLTTITDGSIISRGNLHKGSQSMIFWGEDEKSAFLASFSSLSSTSKLLVKELEIPTLKVIKSASINYSSLIVDEDEDAIAPTIKFRDFRAPILIFSVFRPLGINLKLNEYEISSSVQRLDINTGISSTLIETKENTFIDYRS